LLGRFSTLKMEVIHSFETSVHIVIHLAISRKTSLFRSYIFVVRFLAEAKDFSLVHRLLHARRRGVTLWEKKRPEREAPSRIQFKNVWSPASTAHVSSWQGMYSVTKKLWEVAAIL
jgi:hypothetical protein